jgi:hypothetical protein
VYPELVEHRTQSGLVVGQRFVLQARALDVQAHGMVFGFAHVNAANTA